MNTLFSALVYGSKACVSLTWTSSGIGINESTSHNSSLSQETSCTSACDKGRVEKGSSPWSVSQILLPISILVEGSGSVGSEISPKLCVHLPPHLSHVACNLQSPAKC